MSDATDLRLPARRIAAVSAASMALALAACGEKEEPDLSTVPTETAPTVPTPTVPPATPQGGTGTGSNATP